MQPHNQLWVAKRKTCVTSDYDYNGSANVADKQCKRTDDGKQRLDWPTLGWKASVNWTVLSKFAWKRIQNQKVNYNKPGSSCCCLISIFNSSPVKPGQVEPPQLGLRVSEGVEAGIWCLGCHVGGTLHTYIHPIDGILEVIVQAC